MNTRARSTAARGARRQPGRTVRGALAGVLAATGLLVAAAGANAATVYDNSPTPLPQNVVSLGYQATQSAEFGGQIRLEGTERQNPVVTVTMSSWGCGTSGTWNGGDCVTNPGDEFSHPITLNLHSVLPNGEPGGLIASVTDTFDIPYRPSADPDCTGGDAGKWSSDGGATCSNGIAHNIEFDLTGRGVSLPDRVIVSIAYDTTTWGYDPIGATACSATAQGCPYDALNVGLSEDPPTVGSLPRPDDGYWNTHTAAWYCDSGAGGVDVFRLDAGCWAPYQIATEIDATETTGPPGPQGEQGEQGSAGGVAGAVGGTKKKKKGCKKIKNKVKRKKCFKKKKKKKKKKAAAR